MDSSLTIYDKYLAGLLMISFFLPIRLQGALFIGIATFWVFRDFKYWKSEVIKGYRWAFVLTSMYLLHVVYLFFTPKQFLPNLNTMLEGYASMLLLPFVFTLINPETKKIIHRSLLWFVLANVISCLIGNIYYLAVHNNFSDIPGHVLYRQLFESATGIHPTYMGMFLCFSVCILFLNDRWKRNLRNWVIVVVYLIFFVLLLALFPKTPMIAMGLVVIYWAWLYRKQKDKLFPLLGALAIAIIIAWLFIPFAGQRLDEFSTVWKNHTAHSLIDNSVNMRKLIWKIDWSILKKNWITGVGPGQIINELTTQYMFYSIVMHFPLGVYNTHNQYIHFWICFGVLGLVLFLLILFVHYRKAVKLNSALYISLLILLTICFFTENVLARQYGVIFYALFTSVFFFSEKGYFINSNNINHNKTAD